MLSTTMAYPYHKTKMDREILAICIQNSLQHITTFNRREDETSASSQAFIRQARKDYATVEISFSSKTAVLQKYLSEASFALNRGAMLCHEAAALTLRQMILLEIADSFSLVGLNQGMSHQFAIIGLNLSEDHYGALQENTIQVLINKNPQAMVIDLWNKVTPIYPIQDLVSNTMALINDGQIKDRRGSVVRIDDPSCLAIVVNLNLNNVKAEFNALPQATQNDLKKCMVFKTATIVPASSVSRAVSANGCQYAFGLALAAGFVIISAMILTNA